MVRDEIDKMLAVLDDLETHGRLTCASGEDIATACRWPSVGAKNFVP